MINIHFYILTFLHFTCLSVLWCLRWTAAVCGKWEEASDYQVATKQKALQNILQNCDARKSAESPKLFLPHVSILCVIVTAVIQKSSRAILLICGISVGKYAFLVIGSSIPFVQAVTSIVVWSAISHITNNCTAVHPNSNLPDLPRHHHHYHLNYFSHHPRHPHQLSLFRWKAMWTGH